MSGVRSGSVPVIPTLSIRASLRKSVVGHVAVVIKQTASVREIAVLVTHEIGRNRFVLEAQLFEAIDIIEDVSDQELRGIAESIRQGFTSASSFL